MLELGGFGSSGCRFRGSLRFRGWGIGRRGRKLGLMILAVRLLLLLVLPPLLLLLLLLLPLCLPCLQTHTKTLNPETPISLNYGIYLKSY